MGVAYVFVVCPARFDFFEFLPQLLVLPDGRGAGVALGIEGRSARFELALQTLAATFSCSEALQVRDEVHECAGVRISGAWRSAVAVTRDPFLEHAPQLLDRGVTRDDRSAQPLLL